MASETGTYDGNELPKYASINFSLISRWGDGYNQKQPPLKDDTKNIEQIKQEAPSISNEDKQRIQQDSQKAFDELLKDGTIAKIKARY